MAATNILLPQIDSNHTEENYILIGRANKLICKIILNLPNSFNNYLAESPLSKNGMSGNRKCVNGACELEEGRAQDG